MVQHGAGDGSAGGEGAGGDARAAAEPAEVHLVLRKWKEILTAMEFRCFVKDNTLIAISQRDHTTFYASLASIKTEVQVDLVSFFGPILSGI